jgi:Ca2+-binding EF-hand superfamily protein
MLDFLRTAPRIDDPYISSREEEFKRVFLMIDSLAIADGSMSIEELELYALYRFKTYTGNNTEEGEPVLLDEFSRVALTPDNAVIHELEFLAKLDLNSDGKLSEDELTIENITILFNKAKELHSSYDLNCDGKVSWEEFYFST